MTAVFDAGGDGLPAGESVVRLVGRSGFACEHVSVTSIGGAIRSLDLSAWCGCEPEAVWPR